MSIAEAECALYQDVWAHPDYHKLSPGAEAASRFFRLTGAVAGECAIDFGCGTGKGAAALQALGLDVVLTDQTDAGLEFKDDPRFPFVRHCLWQPWTHGRADYGFCCDVLEHVPTELTALTIARMVDACDVLYLEVSTVPDQFGMLVGQPLHKTVKPFVWWRDLCREIGTVTQGVDMLTRAAFVIRGKHGAA
jgi:hypothetical protein